MTKKSDSKWLSLATAPILGQPPSITIIIEPSRAKCAAGAPMDTLIDDKMVGEKASRLSLT
jgi:hypothetical protein